MDSAKVEAGVRRFFARGRPARLAACAVVALAAVVWLGVAIVVLRFVFIVALLLVAVWCAWLVAVVWRGSEGWEDHSPPALHPLWLRVRLAFAALAAHPPPVEHVPRAPVEPAEAAPVAVRAPVDSRAVELVGRQERLHADAERVLHEFAAQIEAMRNLVARIVQFEQEVSRLAVEREPALRHTGETAVRDLPDDPELRSAFDELEAELRLDKIEEREQLLDDRERRLDRRERELAAFVAETQSRLS